MVLGIVKGLNEDDGDCTVNISHFCDLGTGASVSLQSLSIIIAHLYVFFSATSVTVFSTFTDKCLVWAKEHKETIKIHTHVVFNINLSVQLQLSAQLPCLIIREDEEA